MASRDLHAELCAGIDATFAETIRHLPQKNGARDQDREITLFYGILRSDPERDVGISRRNTRLRATGAVLRIDRAAWPELAIHQHDKIVALDRVNKPIFEILSLDSRSHLRLICELGDG